MGIYDGYDDYHVREGDDRPACAHDTSASERRWHDGEQCICERCSKCERDVPVDCAGDRAHGASVVVDAEHGEAYCRRCAMRFALEDRRDRVLGRHTARTYLERWAERVMKGESPQAAADALRIETVDASSRGATASAEMRGAA